MHPIVSRGTILKMQTGFKLIIYNYLEDLLYQNDPFSMVVQDIYAELIIRNNEYESKETNLKVTQFFDNQPYSIYDYLPENAIQLFPEVSNLHFYVRQILPVKPNHVHILNSALILGVHRLLKTGLQPREILQLLNTSPYPEHQNTKLDTQSKLGQIVQSLFIGGLTVKFDTITQRLPVSGPMYMIQAKIPTLVQEGQAHQSTEKVLAFYHLNVLAVHDQNSSSILKDTSIIHFLDFPDEWLPNLTAILGFGDIVNLILNNSINADQILSWLNQHPKVTLAIMNKINQEGVELSR